MRTEFDVSRSPDGILIRADREIADNLMFIIDALLDLARMIRRQQCLEEAARRAADPADRARRKAAFELESRKIYRRYRDHLDDGCAGDKKAAVRKVREEFNLSAADAGILIREGHRIEKERRRQCQKKDFL